MVLPMTATTCNVDLNAYKELGVTQCNWQLFNDDIKNPNKAVQKIKEFGVEVVSLHSPFNTDDWTAPMIENFTMQPNQIRILYGTEEICTLLNKRLPIVFHSAIHDYNMDLIYNQAILLDKVLDDCPHLDILIENTCVEYPFTAFNYNAIGLPNLIPTIVSEFNKYMSHSVYSCLDICHTEMVTRISNLLTKEGVVNCKPITVEDFFKAFSNSCKLIHFANIEGYGYLPNTHGIGFGEEDRTQLCKYLDYCKKYLPNAQIVLEISESDYETRPNLVKTLKTLKNL